MQLSHGAIAVGLCLMPLASPNSLWSQLADTDRSAQRTSANLQLFESKILPVLVSKCYRCHSEKAAEPEGGLLLDSAPRLTDGGESGRVVVPGNPDASLLFKAVNSEDDPMPPDERLSEDEIASIRQWILQGAHDPRIEADSQKIIDPDYTQAREFWSFRPVRKQKPPQVQNSSWPRNAIDQFVLARLEANSLHPAKAARPEALIRRVYFDLTGLPPSPKQVADFADNPSDAAYQEIVESLLDSPRYGERFAQRWLDVVRYAETEGFEYDRKLEGLWRYRDYVIDAFNQDMPYDQFLREQIAGDEMATENRRLRIATGFHRLGAVRRNAGNQKVASSRNEVLTERTDVIGSVVLGLSIGCARCHDHKFDPIPQQDYYRLQAFFAASHEKDLPLLKSAEHERQAALKEELDEKIAKLKAEVANLDGDAEQRVREQIAEFQEQLPPPSPTVCTVENVFEESSTTHLLRRGDPNLPGPKVGMRSLGVLTPEHQPEIIDQIKTPRTMLAQDLTRVDHPLTARVMTNRIWQHHFGTAIVSTANDFGKNGTPPSHPNLLDYLAERFVSLGWKIKPLHRMIVLSSTYRQSSVSTLAEQASTRDPSNRLLWRFPRRRLSGEEIRDAMLSAAGVLNTKMGGESVILPVEQQLVDQLYKPSQWEVTDDTNEHYRRSIYLLAKRNLRLPFMEVFDQPSAQTSCPERGQSTHARQALELLNGEMTNQISQLFARRLTRIAGEDSEAVVTVAYQSVASRLPSALELKISRQFIDEVGIGEFALAMFNINSFLYVD